MKSGAASKLFAHKVADAVDDVEAIDGMFGVRIESGERDLPSLIFGDEAVGNSVSVYDKADGKVQIYDGGHCTFCRSSPTDPEELAEMVINELEEAQ